MKLGSAARHNIWDFSVRVLAIQSQGGAGRKYHPAIPFQTPIAVTYRTHSRNGPIIYTPTRGGENSRTIVQNVVTFSTVTTQNQPHEDRWTSAPGTPQSFLTSPLLLLPT